MHVFLLADASDFDLASAFSACVSAALSDTPAMLKCFGGSLFAAILAWFLVLGWTRLWNTEWKSGGLFALQAVAAILSGSAAFLIVATFQGDAYIGAMEQRMEAAVGGNANWKRGAFEEVRSQLPVLDPGASEKITLTNRSDLLLLSERAWNAAFAAANNASELPFRLDPLRLPGPDLDVTLPVFPVEITADNEWSAGAQRAVLRFWKTQTETWLPAQLKGLRLPLTFSLAGILAMILAATASMAWKDINA